MIVGSSNFQSQQIDRENVNVSNVGFSKPPKPQEKEKISLFSSGNNYKDFSKDEEEQYNKVNNLDGGMYYQHQIHNMLDNINSFNKKSMFTNFNSANAPIPNRNIDEQLQHINGPIDSFVPTNNN